MIIIILREPFRQNRLNGKEFVDCENKQIRHQNV